MNVASGELVQLSGPNGAGKTTLMKILVGLLRPTSGDITLSAESGLEYLPSESNGLYGRLNAVQNLRFFLSLRGCTLADSEIHEALAKWNLHHEWICRHLAVDKFSTGMKRRLALTRVMLSPSKLWLLDEPLYGLDEKAIQTFRTMLEAHLRHGGAAIMVSHEKSIFDGLQYRSLALG
jgi:heme exporter protein A